MYLESMKLGPFSGLAVVVNLKQAVAEVKRRVVLSRRLRRGKLLRAPNLFIIEARFWREQL
jgi:hypothetical protein